MTDNTNSSNPLNNPNDKFFRALFGLIILVKPFIRQFLPKDLLQKLDLDTLEIDPNSYINDELKEHFSDFVWSCRLKNSQEQRKIAFLLEHKSFKPAYPHFQLYDYLRGAWKLQITAGQRLVPMIPIIFYHGRENWEYEPFDSYFGTIEPETMRFLPCFDYIFINLHNYSDEQINKIRSVFLQKALIVFKHYWDKNYIKLNIVKILFSGYDDIKNEYTRSFIQIFTVYLTSISGMSRKELINQANQSDNNLKKEAMSIIEEFIEIGQEKGIKIGEEKGIKIGEEKSIIKLHQKGMSAELIAEYLEYPIDAVKKIIKDFEEQ
jgi:predicted transposase/invertase (TIGR01784 family)